MDTDSYAVDLNVFLVPFVTLKIVITAHPAPVVGPHNLTLKIRADMEVEEIPS